MHTSLSWLRGKTSDSVLEQKKIHISKITCTRLYYTQEIVDLFIHFPIRLPDAVFN
jgi:hypothetical protein